jgi:hypothetical protein
VGILPTRRGQTALIIAGVAVFAPAAVAAFMFTALGVCLLGSSTAVVDMLQVHADVVFVWPQATSVGGRFHLGGRLGRVPHSVVGL